MSGLLAWGWSLRDAHYLRAEDGLGYQLGIVGATTMLLAVLVYSLRKRVRGMSTWGPLAPWLRLHIWLGVLGPCAILFHANFELGSLNSSVALTSMLLVAGSGVMGRFIYVRIHSGVHGRRLKLKTLMAELTEGEDITRPLLEAFPEVTELLARFESRYTVPPRTPSRAIWRLLILGPSAWWLQRRCLGRLSRVLAEERQHTVHYILLLRSAAGFAAYERLFRVWSLLHISLFVLLVLTAVLHVVAVHMY